MRRLDRFVFLSSLLTFSLPHYHTQIHHSSFSNHHFLLLPSATAFHTLESLDYMFFLQEVANG